MDKNKEFIYEMLKLIEFNINNVKNNKNKKDEDNVIWVASNNIRVLSNEILDLINIDLGDDLD